MEKSKDESRNTVTNYSIIKAVVLLIKVKIKRFIKEKIGNVIGKIKQYWKQLNLDKNWKMLIEGCFNVLITGIIINYIVIHRNWFSYGLLSIVVMWYLKWFKKLTIARNTEEIDKL